MLEVGIFGATGYTGAELVKLLARHPDVQLGFASSESYAGQRLTALYPAAPDVPLIAPGDARLDQTDLVFLCLPHTASAPIARQALDSGARVIDLSADFRLRDPALYAKWYQAIHPAPELLAEAVYGLTEVARPDLASARLVANPGCYPTSVLLPLRPLLQASVISGAVVVDAKSGVSGAGRTPQPSTHFVEVADNLKPYKIGRSHRHLPEMEQALGWWSDSPPELIFAPHLLPVSRGLLSTIYVPLAEACSFQQIRMLFDQAYGQEAFVSILPEGDVATLAHVVHTNRCAIGVMSLGSSLILTSAIDNLLKGAAGQAVQNMNVMCGFEETAGLL
jgi:N-acetyl-gamma-glutamyl-phosphate reductase